MNDPDRDSIEQLKRKLYGRQNEAPPLRRSPLEEPTESLPRDWSARTETMSQSKFLQTGWLVKALALAALFFLLVLGAAVFIFSRGGNTVSSGNVAVAISGPIAIRSGATASLAVSVTNNNGVAMEYVDLIAEYPAGARSPADLSKPLTRERLSLGTIAPGAIAKQTLQAVLFGEKDAVLPIKVTAEYRLANSNAILDSEKDYQIGISSSPVDVTLDAPEMVASGQDLTLKVTINANTEAKVQTPLVVLTYPAGFQFKQASIAPTDGNNVWQLDELAPGDKLTLTIKGTLVGQNAESKAFRVEVGSGAAADDTAIAIPFGAASRTLTIEQTAVALGASLNNSTADNVVATSREPVTAEVTWQNNLPTPVTDGELSVSFAGDALDDASFNVSGGVYQSAAHTIDWNKTNLDSLATINPGQSGKVNFSFTSLSLLAANNYQIKNPTIAIQIVFQAKRVAADGGTEPIRVVINRTIKINSVVQLAAKVFYAGGPFQNRGPLPPRVGLETTYTLTWSLVNSSSDLKEATVRATLPSYLTWLGNTAPAGENLTFTPADGGGGEVVWDLGTLSGGAGFAAAPRTASFQVSLSPSLSQADSAPVLLETPHFSGTDVFTGATLTAEPNRELNTDLVADPQFQIGQGRVVK